MSNFAPAVEAATKLIAYLAYQGREVGISEISRGIEMNKNMVFRILNSLEQEGWVYCHEQKYALTLLPFQLTSKSLSRMNLYTAATPGVLSLWRKTGESTYLGVRKEDKICYLQHYDGTGDVRVAGRVGGEYQLYCSAPGKVVLAYADSDFISQYVKGQFPKRTANTITEAEEMLAHLEQVRRQGYATDCEEFGNGITCVAAPIRDYTGAVVGAVGCSAFTLSSDSEAVVQRLLPDVLAAAREISVCLGAELS